MSPDTPARIGRYEIVDVIGRGGMVTVYKAIQPSPHRIVAIKVLQRRQGDDPAFVERFDREARAVAAMSHPNIVQVIDRDRDGDTFFFVMEYVEGMSLQSMMTKRRLTFGEALSIAKEVGKGLQFAHRNGISHCSLNPRNVLVSEDLTVVKIADLGISRVESLLRRTDTRTTRQASLGTLYCYAPEQAEDPATVDHRTDIYALGVICYEMLTGKVPIGKFSLPTQLNQMLPPEVDSVVLKCLAFDREQRYQTVAAFLADVDALEKSAGFKMVAELRSLARSTSNLLGRSKTAIIRRRRPLGLTAAGLVAVLLLTLAAVEFMKRRGVAGTAPPVSPASETGGNRTEAQTPAPPPAATTPERSEPPALEPLASKDIAAVASAPASIPSAVIEPGEEPPAAKPPAPAAAAARPGAAPAAGTPAPGARPDPKAAATAARDFDLAHAKVDAGRFDEALADLQAFLNRYPDNAKGIDAWFLVARVRELQDRPTDAIAAYTKIVSAYTTSPRAAEAMLKQAQLILKSRGRENEARALLARVAAEYANGPWAVPALVIKAGVEERLKIFERDPFEGGSSASALVTYRTLAEKYPTHREAEAALWKVGAMYEDANRFGPAAQAFAALGTRFPQTNSDAWFRAGDLYDKRLDKPAEARDAFLKVPKTSPHFEEARRRAERLKK